MSAASTGSARPINPGNDQLAPGRNAHVTARDDRTFTVLDVATRVYGKCDLRLRHGFVRQAALTPIFTKRIVPQSGVIRAGSGDVVAPPGVAIALHHARRP